MQDESTATNRWSKPQTVLAFYLYCQIPFKKAVTTNPKIIELANLIGRSVNSVKMKIGNFGSFDPELKKLGIVGLFNTSKLDLEVWTEYSSDWEKLVLDSEKLINEYSNNKLEEDKIDLISQSQIITEKERLTKTRVGQTFFRQSVMSSYREECCVTGLNIPELLVASHIVPWAHNEQERLNPKNGLLLNALHDSAFDKGFITISTDFKIRLSTKVHEYISKKEVENLFSMISEKTISLPEKFVPEKQFLEYHNDIIFLK